MKIHDLDLRVLRSFATVIETGSMTDAARVLGRSQPAISLQMRRLEEMTGKALLHHEGHRISPTEFGDLVLSYARTMLRQHDDLVARLRSPDVEGHVVLGTPDLYAAYMLPSILRVFREAFPRIQVELRCSLSTPLVDCVHRGEVDIALVTRMKNFSGGQVVRQEELVWLRGEGSDIHRRDPVPLALLPPGNIYRDYAIEYLERAGRTWQIACVSESVGGLQAAVFAGMAVTVLCRCAMVPGMRHLSVSENFPRLPRVDLLLYMAPGTTSAAAKALHDCLARYLGELPGGKPTIPPASVVQAGQPAIGSLAAS
jgi:DNA-binding transcriptional LysR family regulator